jgi:hypothetical protein
MYIHLSLGGNHHHHMSLFSHPSSTSSLRPFFMCAHGSIACSGFVSSRVCLPSLRTSVPQPDCVVRCSGNFPRWNGIQVNIEGQYLNPLVCTGCFTLHQNSLWRRFSNAFYWCWVLIVLAREHISMLIANAQKDSANQPTEYLHSQCPLYFGGNNWQNGTRASPSMCDHLGP